MTPQCIATINGHGKLSGAGMGAWAFRGDDEPIFIRLREVMHESLGVHPENDGARSLLVEEEWWDVTPGSTQVRLALAIYPNAA